MIVHFSIIFVVKLIIKILFFLYNAFNRGNLTNDIVNSNNDNSNSNNSNSNNAMFNYRNFFLFEIHEGCPKDGT